MLLPWGRKTIIEHLIHTWSGLGAHQVVILIAQDDHALSRELDRIGFPLNQVVLNPDPGRGMFSSIQCAAQWSQWSSRLTHWAITLGDQPHLSGATLRHLLVAASKNPKQICQPELGGRPAHPVILPAVFFRALAATDATNLKSFLHQHKSFITLIHCTDAGLGMDIDTPEEYTKVWTYYKNLNL